MVIISNNISVEKYYYFFNRSFTDLMLDFQLFEGLLLGFIPCLYFQVFNFIDHIILIYL